MKEIVWGSKEGGGRRGRKEKVWGSKEGGGVRGRYERKEGEEERRRGGGDEGEGGMRGQKCKGALEAAKVGRKGDTKRKRVEGANKKV